ncbi:MAG TPA: orotate phosphoribosyltransferase [Gemmataceae bacterium]|nr:orotate phosphoribosyltransferase [Gemmataceae bacterium]
MTENEKQLFHLLQERAFQRGTFRLASGLVSDYYIDGKTAEAFSESAFLIGEVLYERSKDLPIDALGGLEIGAVPLTTAAVISYHLHSRKMEGFWVRDKAKIHGTRKVVEGNLRPGSRVAILDDVITTGGSAGKAIKEVKEMGCEVVVVLALVDRLQGAAKFFQDEGIAHYQAIFTIRDFGVEI